MKRYSRNMNMLSQEENESLKNYRVCVVGCGGLGGYIIEMLGRLGIGHITAIDGDVFDESNLNRQLLSDNDSIGIKKAEKAKERMKMVNHLIEVSAIPKRLNKENGLELLEGHNVIVDALDNIETRFILQDISSQLNIPLVHGAIGGWYGQVTTIFPGDDTFNIIYKEKNSDGLEKDMGNPSFTPALVASIQVSEVVKILINKGQLLRKKLLYISTLDQEYDIIEL